MKKPPRLDYIAASLVRIAEECLVDVRKYDGHLRGERSYGELTGAHRALFILSLQYPKYKKQSCYVDNLVNEAIYHKQIDAFLEDYAEKTIADGGIKP